MSTVTKVKEKPILFSGPMMRAILDGRKTQTRRIIKPQPTYEGGIWWYEGEPFISEEELRDHLFHNVYGTKGTPYGSLYETHGDRLWVRESWNVSGLAWGMKPSQAATIASQDAWRYQADDTTGWQHGWKPSIHMPRAACRIVLELTDIRVERLHDISAADILAEGVVLRSHEDKFLGKCPVSAFDNACYVDLISLWRAGWQKINGNDSWIANPWVWALSFRRVES